MRLAHDLLDTQVVDRHGVRIGKVDGVILSVSPGSPPRVVAVELSVVTAAHRVHRWLGRWLDGAVRRWRLPIGRTRVPWSRVLSVGLNVKVAIDADRAGVGALERWLRVHVVGRIPGS
jgi:sporulation protein YlmC with PRC-barrel domain